MATEESGIGTATSGSWLRNLVRALSDGCCCHSCLCLFLPGRRRDSRPTRWFQVEDGQLRSNAEPEREERRRRRHRRRRPRRKRADCDAGEGYDANSAGAIINRPAALAGHLSKSEAGRAGGAGGRAPEPKESGGRVSEQLRHLLLHAVEGAASQVSTAPSSSEATPPLLRSDDRDRYQPRVLMEITSSTQTEGETER